MRQTDIKRYNRLRLISFLMVLIVLLSVIFFVENLLVSFTVALVLSYLLGPFVHSLERIGIVRVPAITICYLILFIGCAFLIYSVMPFLALQSESLKSDLPRYVEGTKALLKNTEIRMESLAGLNVDLDLSSRIASKAVQITESLFEDLPNLISSYLTVLLLIPFIAFFILKDGRRVSRSLLEIVPNSAYEISWNLYSQINRQMGQFVRARIMEALIVGFIVWAGLEIISFPYAGILALFAGITNLVPYIGPVIGAVPPIIIAIINQMGDAQLFFMLSIYLTAQLIDAAILIPFVVAKIVDLHPITVIVALLIGAQFLGVLGMLLAIPVASVIKLTSVNLYDHLVQSKT